MIIDTNVVVGAIPLFKEACKITSTSRKEIISNIGERAFNDILTNTACKVVPIDYKKRDLYLLDIKRGIRDKNVMACNPLLAEPTGQNDLNILAETIAEGETELQTHDSRFRVCVNALRDRGVVNVTAKRPTPEKKMFRGI